MSARLRARCFPHYSHLLPGTKEKKEMTEAGSQMRPSTIIMMISHSECPAFIGTHHAQNAVKAVTAIKFFFKIVLQSY